MAHLLVVSLLWLAICDALPHHILYAVVQMLTEQSKNTQKDHTQTRKTGPNYNSNINGKVAKDNKSGKRNGIVEKRKKKRNRRKGVQRKKK